MIERLSESRVRQKIIEIVAAGKVRHGIPDGCTGAEACDCAKLRLAYDHIKSGQDGLYEHDHKLIIVERDLDWQPRIEFTIYHELTHHLIIEDGDLFSDYWEYLGHDERKFDDAIERCCEMGAAEFLMPRSHVQQMITERGFTVELVEQIAAEYGASIVAAAIQLAVNAPVKCWVVICSYGWARKFWPHQQTLYIEYAPRPLKNAYPIPRLLPIESDHLLYQAYQERSDLRGRTYVPRSKRLKDWPCDGEAHYRNGRVIGLLLLERPIQHSKDQLALPI